MKIFLAFLVSAAASITGALYLCQPAVFDKLPFDAVATLSQTKPAKPGIVVGLSAGKSQVDDVNFLIDSMLEGFEAGMAKGIYETLLGKLDSRKRAGAVAFFDQSQKQPQILLFVPVKETASFVNLLTKQAQFKLGADGTTGTGNWQGKQIHFEMRDKCFYFSDNKETFSKIIDNPETWLREIPSSYNIGLVYDAEQVPGLVRKLLLQDIRQALDSAASSFDQAGSGLGQVLHQDNLGDLIQMFEETKRLKMGVDIASETKQVELFFQADGFESSKLARLGERGEALPVSRYSNFRNDKALINLNLHAPLMEDDARKLQQVIETVDFGANLPDARLRTLADQLNSLLQQAITQEQFFDGALVLRNQEVEEADLAAVFHVSDTDRVESLLRKLSKPKPVEESAFGPLVRRAKPDSRVVTVEGLKFYQQLFKVPGPQKQSHSVVFAVGENEVYVGIGTRPLSLMKSCLESGDVPESDLRSDVLFKINVKDTPLIRMLAPGVELGTRSRIRGDVAFVKPGVASRLLIDASVLKLCYKAQRNLRLVKMLRKTSQ